jgi:hypothetical protein
MSIVVALASTVVGIAAGSVRVGLAEVSARVALASTVSARVWLAASKHNDAARANGARHPLLTFGVIDHLADADGHQLPSHALRQSAPRAPLGTTFGAVAAKRMLVTERELIGW